MMWILLIVGFLTIPETGSAQKVIARVTISNTIPSVGDTTTVDIHIDMTGTTELLGAYSASLKWNPAVLAFISTSAGSTKEFNSPGTNANNVNSGNLRFNQFNRDGARGIVNIISITFKATGNKGDTSLVDLEFSALDAASTFTSPKTSVIDN